MNTIVKDWHIVSIFDGDEPIGKILWGICVDDMTYLFATNDYISTSKIVEISPHNQLIKTASGSIYQVIGVGQKAQIQMKDFELLRHGFSPEQIAQLNLSSISSFH
ncbi:hypothetical protein ATS72_014450 [Pseudoalteromonas sp. 13-15]|uniref:hypothetical protein n=1 Tax=Pseudoalteromonas TaxID=53246 RepID=UPI000730AA27|nr:MULTISPECIES: hypothetical protein [Pseudoalteromonas]AUL74708.1 hypothetical protein ATS72_014450 [Pseudoalteromonas sp. 13-15]WFO19586.1 hypothetical protein ATS73_001610 [Pseudoalteromonas sp. H100]SIO07933.1 hypothetical protein SAMN05878071_2898 [Pseudoalteromonas marina]